MPKTLSKGGRTRERIVEAATDLFSEAGYDQTSVHQIAARCGITHAAALYHFKSKLGLFEAVVESALARVDSIVAESILPTDDAHQRLVKLFTGHLTWMTIYKAEAEMLLLLAYFASVRTEFSTIYSRVLAASRSQIEAILSAGHREGLFECHGDLGTTAKCLHDGLFGMLMNGLAGRRVVEPMPAYLERVHFLIGRATGYSTAQGE